MNIEEILNSNVLLWQPKLELALVRVAELKWWNYIVHDILNLWCGSIKYSHDGGWRTTYEPHACRALNTLKSRGLKIVGVDKEVNEGEEFEHHTINLISSPRDIHRMIRGRFDLVINQNFSCPENTCPDLMSELRQSWMTVDVFNQRLERAANIIMKEGACYSLFGWFYTTKHKVGKNLVQLETRQ